MGVGDKGGEQVEHTLGTWEQYPWDGLYRGLQSYEEGKEEEEV